MATDGSLGTGGSADDCAVGDAGVGEEAEGGEAKADPGGDCGVSPSHASLPSTIPDADCLTQPVRSPDRRLILQSGRSLLIIDSTGNFGVRPVLRSVRFRSASNHDA